MLTSFIYAYGGYDGQHCAGLLDAVRKCTKIEYYTDWIFNPFTLVSLFFFYLVSIVVTPIVLLIYTKYNQKQQNISTKKRAGF